MKWLALATMLALGCGSGDDGDHGGTGTGSRPVGPAGTGGATVVGPDPALRGNWIATINAICGAGANFDGTRYSLNVVCVEGGATAELQSEQGTYSTIRDEVHFLADKSTCPDTVKGTYLNYSATATALTLSGTDGVIAYARNTATGGSGIATYGCFRDGAFTASPLAPL